MKCGLGAEHVVVPGWSPNWHCRICIVVTILICRPSSREGQLGVGGILIFFFFKETLGSSRGPEPRGQMLCNCLGSACAGLSGEPGRAESGSVPSLVNPISHCFLECLLWFLIKHERNKGKKKKTACWSQTAGFEGQDCPWALRRSLLWQEDVPHRASSCGVPPARRRLRNSAYLGPWAAPNTQLKLRILLPVFILIPINLL